MSNTYPILIQFGADNRVSLNFAPLFLIAMDNPQPVLSFDNTGNAFAYKSNKELKKAEFLFASMGYNGLVKLGTRFTPWAIKAGLPIKGLIRNTIFKQFVGGETLEATATVAKKLGEYNVQIILDYGVEGGEDGEQGFDHATDEFIRVIEYAATQPNIPFMSIKVTGFCSFGLLEKIDAAMNAVEGPLMKKFADAIGTLSEKEKDAWMRVSVRMKKICDAAAEKKIGVLVDAEETWIQGPVDALTTVMMSNYNKQEVIVYNTIQLYRHDRLQFLKDSYQAAVERNFILGAKLVRGAYMEKERRRAEELNYASPIQPDKESSDRDYNLAVEFCINHLDRIGTIVASHNENSNLAAARLLQQKNIAPSHPHIHFSQLYGMSDNITFNLAKAGFSVSKYLPFGPIEDVIPYLMRRAQENSSVSGQTGRELALIKKEMQRRKG